MVISDFRTSSFIPKFFIVDFRHMTKMLLYYVNLRKNYLNGVINKFHHSSTESHLNTFKKELLNTLKKK